jgi:hypothetical protein
VERIDPDLSNTEPQPIRTHSTRRESKHEICIRTQSIRRESKNEICIRTQSIRRESKNDICIPTHAIRATGKSISPVVIPTLPPKMGYIAISIILVEARPAACAGIADRPPTCHRPCMIPALRVSRGTRCLGANFGSDPKEQFLEISFRVGGPGAASGPK